jgi:hypothetical protein
MAEEPRPASQQSEARSDRTRVLGVRPGSPRVLAPVDESQELPAAPIRQSEPATNQGARPTSNAQGAATASAQSSSDSADNLAEALRSSRSVLEGLLAKTHEFHEETWRAMQGLFEDLHVKLSQEHQARFANFEKEISERGRYQTTALLDKIDLEAEARLAARLDHVLDKAQEAERQSVRSLNEKAAASQANLVELTSKSMQELERQKAACMADLEARAQKRLSDLKTEQANSIETIAKKTADSLSEQFSKRASLASEAFQKRLQAISEEITGQLEKKLAAMTEAAVTRISNEAQAIIARETSNNLIQALRKRLDQLASSLNG